MELGSQGIQSLITFLGLVTYINLARSLDFDSDSKDPTYSQPVIRAKELVRSLEFSLQAAFEDGATLLSVMQTAMTKRSAVNNSRHWEFLNSVTPSLRKNLDDVCAYITELVDIATAQAEACETAGIDGKIGYRDPSRFASNGDDYADNPDGPYDTGPKSLDDQEDKLKLVDVLVAPRGIRIGDFKNSDNGSSLGPSETLVPSMRSQDSLRTTTPSPQPTVDEDCMYYFKSVSITTKQDYIIIVHTKTIKRKEKLHKILGEDAPVRAVEEKPWYLLPEHGPTELWLNPEGTVRGGTLPALIERLTPHDNLGKIAELLVNGN